jgi:(p)ppGpp synthase/HD superfamily hydrolase
VPRKHFGAEIEPHYCKKYHHWYTSLDSRKHIVNHWSQDKYIKAYRFAADAHNGQLVPGTTFPYLMHISFVAMEITAALSVEQVDNPDLAVQCSVLHDTIEDTDVTYDDVKTRFGSDVADGVMALTIDESIGPDLGKFERRWLQLEDYLSRIKQQPREIWMVKLADRITNLQPPPAHWDERMIARYRQGATLIHKELGEASGVLGERLMVKIDNYNQG